MNMDMDTSMDMDLTQHGHGHQKSASHCQANSELISLLCCHVTALQPQFNTIGLLYSTVPTEYSSFALNTATASWYISTELDFCETSAPSRRCVVQCRIVKYAFGMAMLSRIDHTETGFARLYLFVQTKPIQLLWRCRCSYCDSIPLNFKNNSCRLDNLSIPTYYFSLVLTRLSSRQTLPLRISSQIVL